MNLNYLPVRAKVVKAFRFDGQDHRPGETVELWWLHMKQLEKAGVLERIYEPEADLSDPIRDVMVLVPVYRLEPETVRAVLALAWDGPITHVFQRDNPGTNPKANHLHQYQRGRESFLAGSYDALLIIESDIVPPVDALVKLAALQVDLAYGVYVFRTKHSNTVNIFERYPDNSGRRPLNTGESLSCKPWLLWRAIREGKWPCSGGGFGCLLIRRPVLEALPFHLESGGGYCDTAFTSDVFAAGYTMAADMTVLCDHIDADGTVFHPQLPGMVRADPVRFPLGANGALWT